MDQPQTEWQEQPDYIIMMLENQPTKVSLKDLEEIRKALLKYLEQVGVQVREDILKEFQQNAPRIDPDGTLRIGSWLLDTRFGKFVLTRGQQFGEQLYHDVAYLSRTPEGNWVVTDIGNEYIPLIT